MDMVVGPLRVIRRKQIVRMRIHLHRQKKKSQNNLENRKQDRPLFPKLLWMDLTKLQSLQRQRPLTSILRSRVSHSTLSSPYILICSTGVAMQKSRYDTSPSPSQTTPTLSSILQPRIRKPKLGLHLSSAAVCASPARQTEG